MRLSGTHKFLESLAYRCARWAGTSWAFLAAAGVIVVWLLSGPFFGFSSSWQMVMNTVSSVTTFIMVFLLQRSQNKGALAMQIKLDEIIAALQGANNELINIQELEEKEIVALYQRYQRLAKKIQDTPHISTEAILTGE